MRLINEELQAFIESQGYSVYQRNHDLVTIEPLELDTDEDYFEIQLRMSDIGLPAYAITQDDIDDYVWEEIWYQDGEELAIAIADFESCKRNQRR